MKKITLLAVTLLMSTLLMGGNETYYKKMGEALQGFAHCSSVEDFQELANRFRVIGKVEPDEWLPQYYEALCYIQIAFIDRLDDEERDAYLDKAAYIVARVKEKAAREAEVEILDAFCLTGSLVVDPPGRAMETTPLIHAALARALAMEPDNPRAMFMRISNELGTARYFNQDTGPLCEQASTLLENWDKYEPKSPIHPNWGKEDAAGLVRGCGE